MTTLVIGASGATGKRLVEQLLNMGHKVKAIVRSPENLPDAWKNNDRLSIIKAGLSEMSEAEMAEHVKNCDAVASCLGHNLTLKGIFGKPRRLVTDAVRLTCRAIQTNSPTVPVKFVLMNTTGNRNRDIDEPIALGHRIVIGLVRLLVPPQADNENAADFLRIEISQKNSAIEWVIVRPDGLINEDKVTDYTLHPSPTRNPVFAPGKTSRINVGNFMARLITEVGLWNTWKWQMPVIYK